MNVNKKELTIIFIFVRLGMPLLGDICGDLRCKIKHI